jgi:hypothetical protein
MSNYIYPNVQDRNNTGIYYLTILFDHIRNTDLHSKQIIRILYRLETNLKAYPTIYRRNSTIDILLYFLYVFSYLIRK